MGRVLPILFNTDMVRAILDGRKKVTRRLCKDGNDYTMPDMDYFDAEKRTYAVHNYSDMEHMDKLSIAERSCPICPGDILYVRETWGCYTRYWWESEYFIYRADYPQSAKTCEFDGYTCDLPKWRPSIHMPETAARIWLKVTDVRVERLQDITEEQAAAEGVPDELSYPIAPIYCPTCKGEGQVGSLDSSTLGYVPMDCPDCKTAIIKFANLWNSTIKKADHASYGWNANPWVWVIEFERCEKPDN